MSQRINQPEWKQQYGAWAVVTGASDGIGKAIATSLASVGMNLVLVARRRNVLEAFSSELTQTYNIETQIIDADLSNTEAVNHVIDKTKTLDVGLLVASAGFGTAGEFINIPIERELNMLDVNCRAVVMMSHAYGRRFAEQGRGGIILFSSLVAFQGVPHSAHYAATKAYIQSLAEGLHQELAPKGVHVLASAPGPIASGFAARADMQMSMSLKPEAVAEDTLNALGRKMTVEPGWLSKLLIGGLSFLPRSIRVRVMEQIMKDMTQHQQNPTTPVSSHSA